MPRLPPKPNNKGKRYSSAKREAFVREYLIDANATAAARRAGYTGKDSSIRKTGFDLLRDPWVAAELEKARAERAKRLDISADRVLQEYQSIALMDMSGFVQAQLGDPEAAKLFSDPQVLRAAQIKFEAKLRALYALGKHLGMFIEKLDVKLQGHVESLLDAVKPYMSKQAHAEFRTAVRAEMGLRGMAPPGGDSGGGENSGTDSGTGQLH